MQYKINLKIYSKIKYNKVPEKNLYHAEQNWKELPLYSKNFLEISSLRIVNISKLYDLMIFSSGVLINLTIMWLVC